MTPALEPMSLLWITFFAAVIPIVEESSAQPARDPVQLAAAQAYEKGLQLQRDGNHVESVPWFRRAMEHHPPHWQLCHDLALALQNAALKTPAPGGSGAVPRATDARVGAVVEALRQLDRAERLAPGRAERAVVLRSRGHLLRVWGFPAEALFNYERAADELPQWSELRHFIRDYRDVLARGGGRWINDPSGAP